MTWGSAGLQWGRTEWGDLLIDDVPTVFLDGNTKGVDLTRVVSLDGLGQALDQARVCALDGLAKGVDLDLSCVLDCYVAPVLPGWDARVIAPVVLVELRLAAGTVRVANRTITVAGATWDGRLAEAGSILRTLADGTEDMSIEVDDTTTRGPRFRDLFLANPPEGRGVSVYLALVGDSAAAAMHVWEGRIDRVTGISLATARLEALRTERVDDRVLGRVVTATDYPNAPESSLGRMLPIVFGDVQAHEGIIIDTLARGQLALGMFPGDTSASLRSTDGFAAGGGMVQVEAERFLWFGVSGAVLQGLHRGQESTLAAFHPKGADVVEVGPFRVVLAGHALARIENVRILDASGGLGVPVPEPDIIDHDAATLTWSDGMPRIRPATPVSQFMRVHFDRADSTNLATNPEKAAREADGYDALGYADLSTGPLVLLTNTDGLGQPGDLQRVWIAVVFDPSTCPPDGARVGVAGRSYSLQPTDTVPDDVTRHDERTGDRIYEVTDEPFEVDLGTEARRILPNNVLHPGIFGNRPLANNVIDDNEDTYAAFSFMGAGEVSIVGSVPARFKLVPKPDLTGFTVTACRLEFVAGWSLTPFSSPMVAQLTKRGQNGLWRPIGETVIVCQSRSPLGSPLGRIVGIETFSVEFDPLLLGANGQLEDMEDIEWQVLPMPGTAVGLWVGREFRLEVTLSKASEPVTANVEAARTVTNYFEVTAARNGRIRGEPLWAYKSMPLADATRFDWGFFSDTARGGKVTITPQGSNAPRIIETFWCVQFAPFEEVDSPTPRVFADVVGRVPDGNPVDVAESIITTAVPGGMGLGLAAIDRTRYVTARASTAADGLRLDFAVTSRMQAVDLLREVAAQADMRQGWQLGRHVLVRRPRADVVLSPVKTVGTDDVLESTLSLSRTPLDEVRTRLVSVYRPSQVAGGYTGAAEAFDSAGESTFGRREDSRTMSLVRDETTALLVTNREVERKRKPRWEVRLELPPLGFDLRQGDILTLAHRDFEALVVEVVSLTIETRGLLRVAVHGVVWHVS